MKSNKRGISLIVLVITIIVMIILATAIILSLNGNNIVGKAKEATNASNLANARQVVALAKSEWQLMTKEQQKEFGTFPTFAKQELEEAGFGKAENLSDELGYIVDLYTKEASVHKLNVGDYVLYNYTGNSSYSVDSKLTGYEAAQVFNSVDGEQVVSAWRVLSTDDGIIRLVSEKNVPTLCLDGKEGYLNGPKVLDDMCKALYSGDLGTARNLKLDDVKKLLSIATNTNAENEGYYYYKDKTGATVKVPGGTTMGQLESTMVESDKMQNRITPSSSIKFEDLKINNFTYSVPPGGQQNLWWDARYEYENEHLLELVWPGTATEGTHLSDAVVRPDYEDGFVKYCIVQSSGKRNIGSTTVYNSMGQSEKEEGGEYRFFSYRPVVQLKPGLEMEVNTTKKVAVTGDTSNTAVFNVWEIVE